MAKDPNKRNLLHQPFEMQVEVLRNLKGGQQAIVTSMPSESMHVGTFSEYVQKIAAELGAPIGDSASIPYYHKTQSHDNETQLIIGRRASLPPRR